MRHQYDALECQLGGFPSSLEDHERGGKCILSWETDIPGCPPWAPLPVARRTALPADADCIMHCRSYRLPPPGGGAARVCYVAAGRNGVLDRSRAGCWSHMRGADVAVVNVGIHFNDPDTVRRMTAQFADFWVASVEEEGPAALPALLWRETTAQHFGGEARGGNYGGEPGDQVCAAVGYDEARETDFRNGADGPQLQQLRLRPISPCSPHAHRPRRPPAAAAEALPVLHAARIPVLRAWNATQRLGPGHHPAGRLLPCGSAQCAEIDKRTRRDCTHFCLHPGSVPEALNIVLAAALARMPERGGGAAGGG